jgi:hypothetical protein
VIISCEEDGRDVGVVGRLVGMARLKRGHGSFPERQRFIKQRGFFRVFVTVEEGSCQVCAIPRLIRRSSNVIVVRSFQSSPTMRDSAFEVGILMRVFVSDTE